MKASRAIEATALYPADEAAKLAHLHPVTLRKKLRCGAIKGKKRSGQWLVLGSELLALA